MAFAIYSIPALLLFSMRRRRTAWYLSPTFIVALVLVAFGLLAQVGGSQVHTIGEITLTGDELRHATFEFGFAASALTIGAWFATSRLTVVRPEPRSPTPLSVRARQALLVASAVPLLLVILVDGHQLVRRSTYLFGNHQPVLTVASALAIVAIGVLGYLSSEPGPRQKLSITLLSLAYAALFFALGTRQLALMPIVFGLGAVCSPYRKRPLITLGVAAVMGGLLFPLPLSDRNAASDGLAPYVHQVLANPGGSFNYSSARNNILSPVPVTAASLQADTPPLHWLAIELNPLPGRIAGWYAIAPALRIDAAIPYSGVGEIGTHGPGIAAMFWLLAGFATGILDRRVKLRLELGQIPIAIALAGLAALFALLSTEYNLRSSGRMLWYALIIELGATLLLPLFGRPNKVRKQGPNELGGMVALPS